MPRSTAPAHAEPREIVVAFGIHPRHFGRFAADQRAACLAAAFGDGRDNFGRDGIVELSGRVIVEEKQRLGALDDQVVGAHRNEVNADAVMIARLDRELQLGSDAVVGRHQQWVIISGRLQVEETAEAAKLRIGPGTGG